MNRPPRAFRLGSIAWAVLLGGGVLALGVSILLPSTKSSRLSAGQLRQMQERYERERAEEAGAATQPSTAPATGPTSAPVDP